MFIEEGNLCANRNANTTNMKKRIIKTIFTILALLWLLISAVLTIVIALLLLPVILASKSYYLELLLLNIAIVTALGIYPLGFMYQIITQKNNHQYLRKLSLAIDVHGNTIASSLLNDHFITKQSTHQFGVFYETISDNLGENEKSQTLTPFGQRFANFLSVIDLNHAQKSIVPDPIKHYKNHG